MIGRSPSRRRLVVLIVVVLAALVAPGVASAHAIQVDYKFPFPLWVFLLGGSLAVLLSAPAAALAIRSRTTDWTSRNVGFLARLHLGQIGIVIGSVLLLDGLAGGFFGSSEVFSSPLPELIWVDFWVGLGIVSALFGNLWDFASPLSAAGRALERALARRNVQVRQYPDWLGLWPSVVLLLGWSWAELIWTSAVRPGLSRLDRHQLLPAATRRHGGLRYRDLARAGGAVHRRCADVRALRASRAVRHRASGPLPCRALRARLH